MSDGRNRFSVCTVVRNDEDTEQRMESMRRYQSNCNLMNYTEGVCRVTEPEGPSNTNLVQRYSVAASTAERSSPLCTANTCLA